MLSEIIVVHDIEKILSDFSWIWTYLNKVVQEMGGRYFFVDGEVFNEMPADKAEWTILVSKPKYDYDDIEWDDEGDEW